MNRVSGVSRREEKKQGRVEFHFRGKKFSTFYFRIENRMLLGTPVFPIGAGKLAKTVGDLGR